MEQTTEEKTLTSTQRGALLEKAFPGRGNLNRRRAGGARNRMLDQLERDEYLSPPVTRLLRDRFGDTEGRKLGDKLPPDLRRMGNYITAKGLRALEASLAKKRFDPTNCDLRDVRALIPPQEEFERNLLLFLAEASCSSSARYTRLGEARARAWAASIRATMNELGFPMTIRAGAERVWTDDEVVAFGKKIAGAEYSLDYVRYLSNDDLADMAEELSLERHREGTAGALSKDSKLDAIRAEFARRTVEAA